MTECIHCINGYFCSFKDSKTYVFPNTYIQLLQYCIESYSKLKGQLPLQLFTQTAKTMLDIVRIDDNTSTTQQNKLTTQHNYAQLAVNWHTNIVKTCLKMMMLFFIKCLPYIAIQKLVTEFYYLTDMLPVTARKGQGDIISATVSSLMELPITLSVHSSYLLLSHTIIV